MWESSLRYALLADVFFVTATALPGALRTILKDGQFLRTSTCSHAVNKQPRHQRAKLALPLHTAVGQVFGSLGTDGVSPVLTRAILSTEKHDTLRETCCPP